MHQNSSSSIRRFSIHLVNLRIMLGVLLFNAAIEKTNNAGKNRLKAIVCRHKKKLHNLQKLQQSFVKTEDKQCPAKRIIHYNFSS